jgi:hypothetical protein
MDDAAKTVLKSAGLDLEKRNADGRWTLPVPGTFVIDRSGNVAYAHVDADYRTGGLRPWLYTAGGANFEVGFHLVKRFWGKGFATEAAFGALEYAWEKLRLSQVYAGHHPHNRASEKILKKLGFEFIGNVFYEPTGLMHPSYVCKAPPPRRNASTSP